MEEKEAEGIHPVYISNENKILWLYSISTPYGWLELYANYANYSKEININSERTIWDDKNCDIETEDSCMTGQQIIELIRDFLCLN